MGFGVEKGVWREGEDDALLFLQERVDPCHAQETRPLDGVPEKVNVMHRVCQEKGRKKKHKRPREVMKYMLMGMKR